MKTRRIILLGLVGIFGAFLIFQTSEVQAAEAVGAAAKVLTAEETIIFQQSLVILAETLEYLRLYIEKNKTLPPNADQIVLTLSNINKTLSEISPMIDKKVLAGIKVKTEKDVKESKAAIFEEAEIAAKAEAPAAEARSSLLANVRFLFDWKAWGIIFILLIIGIAVFLRMRIGQEAVQSQK